MASNRPAHLLFRRSSAVALAVALVGTAMTLVLFFEARQSEWTAFRVEFENEANLGANLIQRKLERTRQVVYALRQLFSVGEAIDARSFSIFARPFLLNQTELTAVEWIPFVPQARRSVVEAEGRRRLGPQFTMFERDSDEAPISLGLRDAYFPIFYVEPLTHLTRQTLGFDVGSNPDYRAVLSTACDTGRFIVSSSVKLVVSGEKGIFASSAVYRDGMPIISLDERRAAVVGFVTAVYNIPRLMSEVVEQIEHSSLAFSVLQYSESGARELLYRSGRDDPGAPRWIHRVLPPFPVHRVEFTFGGRPWGIELTLTSRYFDRRLPIIHWLVLPIGGLLTLFLALYFWTVLRQHERLEETVQERTRELEFQSEAMGRILGAMDLAADGIIIVDSNNQLTYANQSLTRTMGLSSMEALIGKRSDEIVVGDTTVLRQSELEVAREVTNQTGAWNGELTLHLPDQVRPAKLLAHFRALPDGGRVAVFTDITEVRRQEEEQNRLERQLEQARKLEALGQLAGGVAHDFNNLLGAILGFAQFIVEDTGEDSAHHRYASRIVKAGQQAKSLIGQILAFSHRGDSAPETVDLADLVDENMCILKAIVAPTTGLRFARGDEGLIVAVQRSQIGQVLVNLVVNASEALGGEAGTVTIEVGEADQIADVIEPLFFRPGQAGSGQPELEAWTADGWHYAGFGHLRPDIGYVCLAITDTGSGMPADIASHIFTPFFTTKGKTGGTGLGLAVVQSIVGHHNGGLLVRTAPGRGSRFSILLPAADAVEAKVDAPAAIAPIAHQGSILLVEDSSHFSDMMMTALFRLGYEISVCDDPRAAIGYIDEDASAWDLVVVDQVMPHMSGTQLIAAIKERHPELPCIICTAFPGQSAEDAARRAGADGFLTKPIDLGRFSLLVKTLIEGRESRPQTP